MWLWYWGSCSKPCQPPALFSSAGQSQCTWVSQGRCHCTVGLPAFVSENNPWAIFLECENAYVAQVSLYE